MECRLVSKAVVERVYEDGEVNCKKSREQNGEMRYALELDDRNGDRIRVVIADDTRIDKHVVVTVIRMDYDDRCECS